MINWTQTAFVFPGQGSQTVGMGKEIADAYPAARQTFDEADEVLGYALSSLCFMGPDAELNDTYYTQPALYVTSMATLRALRALKVEMQPALMAGHSLGELTALAAADVFEFADGLHLVQERGRLMSGAGESVPGAMAAVIGLDAAGVQALCERASAESGGVLVPANDNSPGQIVISGEIVAVDKAVEIGKSMGARLVKKLAVSIASHSPLMAGASASFAKAVNAVVMQPARLPVYGNVTAAPLGDVESIRTELATQLVRPVRWTETIQAMVAAGITTFVEVGSKDVLTGLIKRIDANAVCFNLDSAARLQSFVEQSA
jgi:[acyl-carrier-protein] S-malonyltransferase